MAKFQPGNPGGPGRKRKADQNAGAVARAEKQIRDRLPSLIDNMLALADGIFVEEITETCKRVVYKRPPDRGAIKYLIDRIMGTPTERQEISGELTLLKGYTTREASPDAWDEDPTEN